MAETEPFCKEEIEIKTDQAFSSCSPDIDEEQNTR
jgi:hypothetical protein